MNVAGLDQTYDKFYKLTESLISTIQSGSKPSEISNNTDQKIINIIKEWGEFCRLNHTHLIDKITNMHHPHSDRIITEIKTIETEIDTLNTDHEIDSRKAAFPQLIAHFNDLFGNLTANPRIPSTHVNLIELPNDVIIETVSKFTRLKDVVRTGTICRKTRDLILTLPVWRRTAAFFNVLSENGSREQRKEFLQILKLFYGDRTPNSKAPRFAVALASEFFYLSNSLPKFLTEIGPNGREFFHQLIQNSASNERAGLWLGFCNWIKDKPLDLSFLLQKCSSIRVLSLTGNNNIVDDDLHLIASLAHLKALHCANCGSLRGKGFRFWQQPNTLEVLVLSKCAAFDPINLKEHLHRFSNLQTLKIAKLKLKDEHLADLNKLTHLNTIDLSENEFLTDKTLETLANIKTLKEINLTGVKGITLKGLMDLRSALPKSIITNDIK